MLVEISVRGSRRADPYAWEVWTSFAGGSRCPYCGHEGKSHTVFAGQPFIYAEEQSGKLRRRPVAKKRKAAVVFCGDCAEDLGTEVTVCYLERYGVGEVLLADGRVLYPDGVGVQPSPRA